MTFEKSTSSPNLPYYSRKLMKIKWASPQPLNRIQNQSSSQNLKIIKKPHGKK